MKITRNLVLSSGITLVAATLLIGTTVQAKPPRSEAQVAHEHAMLMQAVAKGDGLWHSSKLGTNGLACANCHPDGAASNPHTFPKFQSNLGKVGNLAEMINWCITVPMQGKPLAYDSDEMISMEAYSTYTHRGVAIAPAKDEQYGAVPVVSGPGYPSQ
jgi:thiosulfate dehydrogenase